MVVVNPFKYIFYFRAQFYYSVFFPFFFRFLTFVVLYKCPIRGTNTVRLPTAASYCHCTLFILASRIKQITNKVRFIVLKQISSAINYPVAFTLFRGAFYKPSSRNVTKKVYVVVHSEDLNKANAVRCFN